jgi:hypothetical protein
MGVLSLSGFDLLCEEGGEDARVYKVKVAGKLPTYLLSTLQMRYIFKSLMNLCLSPTHLRNDLSKREFP